MASLWAQAAHDLNQPVQAVLLLARTLDQSSARAEMQRTVRHIEAALESLGGMLDLLGLLSRLEAGLQVVQLRSCQIVEVVGPVIGEVKSIAAGHDIKLRSRTLRATVRSHPRLLAAATRSLLLNAVRLAGNGEVVAQLRRTSGHLTIEARFAGSPIDAARERNAFVELPPPPDRIGQSQLGLGLGLLEHLCRRLEHSFAYACPAPRQHRLSVTLPLAGSR